VLGEAWDAVRTHVASVVRERERVTAALHAIEGVDVALSDANFLWMGTPRPAVEVYAGLLEHGVLVRSFHATGGRLANRLRVTIGSAGENDRFVDALARVLGAR
jgi:histidinol-phosphate aminotransferase